MRVRSDTHGLPSRLLPASTSQILLPSQRTGFLIIADFSAIVHDLLLFQWQNIFAGCLSVVNYWLVFYNVLREIVDRYVPVRIRKDRYCSSRVRLPRAVRQLVQRKRKPGSVGELNPVLTIKLPSMLHHADVAVQCTHSYRSKKTSFYTLVRASFLPTSLSNCIFRVHLFH